MRKSILIACIGLLLTDTSLDAKTLHDNLEVEGSGTFCGPLKARRGVHVNGGITQKHLIRPLTRKDIKCRSKNGDKDEQYDIVIVGCGTAGSLLTYRMAQRYPKSKILVLDVGQDDVRINSGTAAVPNPNPNNGAGPDAWGQLLRSLTVAFGEGCAQWQDEIVTNPDDQFFRVPVQYARGATLGGTSAINGLRYNRGTKEGTYDRWEEATGDEAFGFDSMVEAFKQVENRSQSTRYFGVPIRYWFPGAGPTPAQTLNQYMGTTGRVYITQNFLEGWTSRAVLDSVKSDPLPGRTGPLLINLDDVNPANPVEYAYFGPRSEYDQSDLNFPSFNPYPATTPGTTYTPPADPANKKGPEYAGAGIKALRARSYAAPAFVYPILDNKMPHNVTIKQRVYVTKLLFSEKKAGEVIGVEYVEGENGEAWQVALVNRAIARNVPPYKGTLSGVDRSQCSFNAAVINQQHIETKRAYAKADVWLSAGVIDSPAIMQRSGIGSREFLESLASQPVACAVDLPGVGFGLRETLDMGINYLYEVDLSTGLSAPFPAAQIEAFYANVFGFADPTNPANVSGSASISGAATQTSAQLRIQSDPSVPFADIDIITSFAPVTTAAGSLLYQDLANIQTASGIAVDLDKIKPVFDRAKWGMYAPENTGRYLYENLALVEFWNPASVGQVTINSGNVFERPEYAPNMCANENDITAMSNTFSNTLLPILQRCATKRFGPRGPATYAGLAVGATNTTITFGAFNSLVGPFAVKPIVGNIDATTYNTPGSLQGYSIRIVAGTGAQQTNVITSWSGSPNFIATLGTSWAIQPDGTSQYVLNPPGATPLDSVAFSDNNHRNFVRFAQPYGDELFSDVKHTQLVNPFKTAAKSTRITVSQPNHGFETGDMIKISGITAPVDGIQPQHINEYHIVYKIDNNSYDIILFWNLTPIGGPGSSPAPNPAANAVGQTNVGGTVTVSTLRFDEGKFRTWLQNHYFSGWHGCCTCRMGKPDDTQAVVDTRARVYNTKGLRVCDASIFPVKPNANTMAPTYGIAQKIFDLVSEEEYDYLLNH